MKENPFLWETTKLKWLITFSKTLPKDCKYSLKKRLVTQFEPSDIGLTKGLFNSIVRADSYDIFTSSILALHYKNWLSFQILNRAQIEMLLFTYWISKNPGEIEHIFSKEVYGDKGNLKKFYQNDKDQMMTYFWRRYNQFYSKKAHPLPTRFISSISFWSYLKPRKKSFDIKCMIDGSFNKLPEDTRKKKIEEWFEFAGYSPGVSAVPHRNDEKEGITYFIGEMCYLHDEILKNLDKILLLCPKFKMEDRAWDTAIRKYRRGIF